MWNRIVLSSLLALALAGLSPVRAQTSFLERDSDGNGRLTLTESQLSGPEFHRLDESGNGELSLGEFASYWNRVTQDPDLHNAPYAGESSRQVLDLYLPARARGETPLLVWIHGGSWKEGDKEACPFQTMTEHGVAVAAIHYRLTDEARFPAQLEDCRAALRYLKKAAPALGVRFTRVTACGLSAGGHLSLLLAGSGEVDAVVAFGAPVDLTVELARTHHRETLERLVGSPLEEHLDTLRLASPLFQMGPPSVRYLLVHGTGDRTIPYQPSLQLTAELARRDVPVELHLVPDGSHTLVGGPPLWQRLVALLTFKPGVERTSQP